MINQDDRNIALVNILQGGPYQQLYNGPGTGNCSCLSGQHHHYNALSIRSSSLSLLGPGWPSAGRALWDRQEGTLITGTLLAPRLASPCLAPAALSSVGFYKNDFVMKETWLTRGISRHFSLLFIDPKVSRNGKKYFLPFPDTFCRFSCL